MLPFYLPCQPVPAGLRWLSVVRLFKKVSSQKWQCFVHTVCLPYEKYIHESRNRRVSVLMHGLEKKNNFQGLLHRTLIISYSAVLRDSVCEKWISSVTISPSYRFMFRVCKSCMSTRSRDLKLLPLDLTASISIVDKLAYSSLRRESQQSAASLASCLH